jgi:trehalose 6-phosphate synthase/phosphatase
MSKLVIVSHRLPVEVSLNDKKYEVLPYQYRTPNISAEGIGFSDLVWIGWMGVERDVLGLEDEQTMSAVLAENNCFPVHLNMDDIERYKSGFCNAAIWPLFHYFQHIAVFDECNWDTYVSVNQRYADVVLEHSAPGDTIWINDYHLLLLPRMLRDASPDLTIGFFLHIPFPSFEVFRIFPWRKEILEGMLGADLIGFHTFDYERHFMSSLRRLMGYDNVLNTVKLDERIVKIDNFPMGIDYEYFSSRSRNFTASSEASLIGLGENLFQKTLDHAKNKLIVSIDRLDYAKGIDKRLEAFELFLEDHPQYHEKVCLALFVIPSREDLAEYQLQKRMVDEIVGRINGRFGMLNWTPVLYFFRQLSRDEKIEMYSVSDVAMVTPMRDGMNLIAKEYIASRTDQSGVLILSELAGASKEMSECIQVNPNNIREMADAIRLALEMPAEEQVMKNRTMQRRLKVYTEQKWAYDILQSLRGVKLLQETNLTRKVSPRIIDSIKASYSEARKRILFLDYDGTLTGFHKDPQKAVPDEELYGLLRKLLADHHNQIVIISGRDKETLEKWFDDFKQITFIAEHGVWIKKPGLKWEMAEQIDKNWMDSIRPVINFYADRTPRSFLEEKNYSLVWHYRNADPDLGIQRSWELKDELRNLVSNLNLEIMDGDKVIEIKNSGINKGRAAAKQLSEDEYQFILAIGDDWTDEYTFGAMPEDSFTIKVGTKNTRAAYYIDSVKSVRSLLDELGTLS